MKGCMLDVYMIKYFQAKGKAIEKEKSNLKNQDFNNFIKDIEQLENMMTYALSYAEKKTLKAKYSEAVPLNKIQIAKKLSISNATVQRHITQINIKFKRNESLFEKLELYYNKVSK